MKPFLTFLTLSLVILTCEAQTRFQMDGQQVTSSAHRLYVNDQMKTRPSRYTFRTVNEALLFAQANNDKDTLWTDICIEPSVYWIDDPDDPAIRVSDVPRESPFGLKVKVDRLRLIGLSDNPEDVVIACNRGQTQGSDGNFTMLHFTGSDIHAENITFGNYCNVDLVYPRNPRLNRPKRNPAIVQAQLVICRLSIPSSSAWAGYAIGGVALLYVIVFLPLWFKKPNPVIFVPCDYAAVLLYLLYIDLTVKGGWFLKFAFPVVGSSALIVTAIVALCHYLRRGYLYIFGGALIAHGAFMVLLELLIGVAFSNDTTLRWSYFPLVGCFIFGMALIVIAISRPLKEALKKKLFF